jgi:hypothetical protein
MGELNLATSLQNLTVLGAGEESVVYSGYVTGGGHSALALSFRLSADVVLEMEMVTPGGDILTVNECQNRDLFWAMRGVSPFAIYSDFANRYVGRRINLRGPHVNHHPNLPIRSSPCLQFSMGHGAGFCTVLECLDLLVLRVSNSLGTEHRWL